MPIRGSKDVKPRYIEFPADLDEQLAAFAESRGVSLKSVIVEACRRHLAYPPAVPTVAPLPDAPPATKPKGKAQK